MVNARISINMPQTSAQYSTFSYGLSAISALSLTLRVASPLPVLLSARGLNTPTHAYLESPPTASTDYSVVKPTHSATVSRSLLASFHWLPIRHRVTFKVTGLVYRSLHETSLTYLPSRLHAYIPTRSLRSSSAHLFV
jgi:hypothetical protein